MVKMIGGSRDRNYFGLFKSMKNIMILVESVVDELQFDTIDSLKATNYDTINDYGADTRVPCTGINSLHSKPEEHQPSGTCNFSRIDNATLHLT